MKKNRLLLKLILIWIAIYFLIVLVNQIIFWRPDQSYTSLPASYAVQKDMPAEQAVFLLGGIGRPYGYSENPLFYWYSTFGNGVVIISISRDKVYSINRYDTYGAWVFYGFMLSLAIAETIIYFRLRKEEVAS